MRRINQFLLENRKTIFNIDYFHIDFVNLFSFFWSKIICIKTEPSKINGRIDMFTLYARSLKPVSFIYSETVLIIKACNVKRHYERKHGLLEQTYVQQSVVRACKIPDLTAH